MDPTEIIYIDLVLRALRSFPESGLSLLPSVPAGRAQLSSAKRSRMLKRWS
jgi:hypothetical protein